MEFPYRSKHLVAITPGVSSFDILAKAEEMRRAGREVVDLSIGEPDLPTPEPVVEAAIKALRDGWTHYVPAPGIREFREAVAEYETERKGVEISPDEVIAMPGGKPVLLYALLALTDEDDEVLYPDPGFTSYRPAIEASLARPVTYSLRAENNFLPDPTELAGRIGPRTRFVILNTPHNPTGSVVPRRLLEEIAEVILAHPQLMVLSDEVYSTITYGTSHTSIISIPGMKERTIIMESFSKSLAMTGWRLGYGIFPRPMVRDIVKLLVNTLSCVTAFVQVAGAWALRHARGEMEKIAKVFEKRYRFVMEKLRGIPGLRVHEPKGAFYLFPDIKATGKSSREFADILLERYGVAVVPGAAYGMRGEGHIRISFAASMEALEKGVEGIRKAMEELVA